VLEQPLAGRLAAELALDWRSASNEQPMALVLRSPRLELKDLGLGAPKLAREGDKWGPQSELKLAPR